MSQRATVALSDTIPLFIVLQRKEVTDTFWLGSCHSFYSSFFYVYITSLLAIVRFPAGLVLMIATRHTHSLSVYYSNDHFAGMLHFSNNRSFRVDNFPSCWWEFSPFLVLFLKHILIYWFNNDCVRLIYRIPWRIVL